MKIEGNNAVFPSLNGPMIDVHFGFGLQSLDLGLNDGGFPSDPFKITPCMSLGLPPENSCTRIQDPLLLCKTSVLEQSVDDLNGLYSSTGDLNDLIPAIQTSNKIEDATDNCYSPQEKPFLVKNKKKFKSQGDVAKLAENGEKKKGKTNALRVRVSQRTLQDERGELFQINSKNDRNSKHKFQSKPSRDDVKSNESDIEKDSDEEYLPDPERRSNRLRSSDTKSNSQRMTRNTCDNNIEEKPRKKNKHPSSNKGRPPVTMTIVKTRKLPIYQKKDSSAPLHRLCIKILPLQKQKTHKCKECGKSFLQQRSLELHEKKHSNKKIAKRMKYSKKRKLISKDFNCTELDLKLPDNHSFSKHLGSSSSEKSYNCKQCGKGFFRLDSLANHASMHNGDRPYLCEVCGKKFSCPRYLIKHGRIHTGEKTYECPQCGKKFAWHESLVYHMKIHSGEKPYSCPQCNKCFLEPRALEKHTRTHSGEKPYQCSQCGKMFARQDSLVDHEKIHSEDKPFKCPECGKSFIKPRRLAKHQRIHNKEGGKRITHLENLKNKYKFHVDGERPYECTDCSKRFSDAKGLVKHAKTHSGLKPYQCEQCGKQFLRNSTLTEHKRIHSGEKPYECKHCGRKFTIYSSLAIHRRRHSGEQPYSCNLCGEKFMWHTALVRHIKVHKGENPYPEKRRIATTTKKLAEPNSVPKSRNSLGDRPFKCESCDKRFKVQTSLARHLAKIHCTLLESKPFFECNWCTDKFESHDGLVEHIRDHSSENIYERIVTATASLTAQRPNYPIVSAPSPILQTMNNSSMSSASPVLQQHINYQSRSSPVISLPAVNNSNLNAGSPVFNNTVNHQNLNRGQAISQAVNSHTAMSRSSPIMTQPISQQSVNQPSSPINLQSVGQQSISRVSPVLQSMALNHPSVGRGPLLQTISSGMVPNITRPPVAHSYNNPSNYCTNFPSYTGW